MTTALYGRFDMEDCEEGVKINHIWDNEPGMPTTKLTNEKPASSPSQKRESHWLSQQATLSIDSHLDSGWFLR